MLIISYQQLARSKVPVATLKERAKANPKPMTDERDEFIIQLLHWFKGEFFKWVNTLPCSRCGSDKTVHAGVGVPNEEDRRYGAGTVELHKCTVCQSVMRFPRYNDRALFAVLLEYTGC